MARILIALPLLLAVLAAPVHAGAARGADLFDENCADCHSLAKPLKNKKGPGLTGIVGRKAAAVPDFNYSEALRAANLTWTPDRLDAYLQAPKQLVPEQQAPKGLGDATVIADTDIYDKPDGQGQKIGTLSAGEVHPLMEPCRDDWCRVGQIELGGFEGLPNGTAWVYSKGFLSFS